MSQDGFIVRSVLYGMLLGLAVICAWLYYPNILTLVHSAAPGAADRLTAMKDKVESVRFLIPAPSLYKKEEKSPPSAGDVPAVDIEAPAQAKQEAQDIPTEAPLEKETLYPFWRFDQRTTAEDFKTKIEKRTGVNLIVGQEGVRYVVYIPAASEAENRQKAEQIQRDTGIIGLNERGLGS